MVRLWVEYDSGPGSLCSGTLVNPSTVSTAAHCVTDFRSCFKEGIRVIAIGGQVDLTEEL